MRLRFCSVFFCLTARAAKGLRDVRKVLFGLCEKWPADDVGFGGFFLFVMDFYPHFCHPKERRVTLVARQRLAILIVLKMAHDDADLNGLSRIFI